MPKYEAVMISDTGKVFPLTIDQFWDTYKNLCLSGEILYLYGSPAVMYDKWGCEWNKDTKARVRHYD